MTTNTGRKVRADAKLEHLNEAQREWLHFLLEENLPYSEVTWRLRAELGIEVGKSTVSAYYRRHVLPLQQQEDAEEVAAFAALPTGDFDEATLRRAKALLWLALARVKPDADLATKLSRIIDKAERYALAVRKVDLEERKVVVKETLVAERAGKAGAKKGAKMKDETWEMEKPGRAETSAGVGGPGEGAEVAAKAQSREGRSEGAEGADRVGQDLGEAAALPASEGGALADVCSPSTRSRLSLQLQGGSELPEQKIVGEEQNLPRFSGYSGVSPKQKEEPRNTRKDTKETERAEGVEASDESVGVAEMAGRGDSIEVAAKAQSREGRSEGAEGFAMGQDGAGQSGDDARVREELAGIEERLGRHMAQVESDECDAAQLEKIAGAIQADFVRFTELSKLSRASGVQQAQGGAVVVASDPLRMRRSRA